MWSIKHVNKPVMKYLLGHNAVESVEVQPTFRKHRLYLHGRRLSCAINRLESRCQAETLVFALLVL
jgi:hypothetical protein